MLYYSEILAAATAEGRRGKLESLRYLVLLEAEPHCPEISKSQHKQYEIGVEFQFAVDFKMSVYTL